MMLRLPLRPSLARWRPLLVFLALALILSNRTFLAWTSSGLETALFNFLFTAWVVVLVLAPEKRWLASTVAALLALARPDGLLAVGATALLCLRTPRAALPLLVVPAHIVWRRFKYGEWLPNTYYAKHVGAWPRSGAYYLASFVLEYALWIWLAVVLLAIFRRNSPAPRPPLPTLLALGVVLFHFLYYTFNVGGDHFEYRVYSHLIVFIGITFLWALNHLQAGPLAAATVLTIALLASWPIPWIHWRETHWLPRLSNTWRLRKPVAPHLPGAIGWYGEAFDRLQRWLIEHYVCMRHEEHRNFYDSRVVTFAPRALGERTSSAENPIFVGSAVGYVGWAMPHVAILDSFGLNDWVIARNPVGEKRERSMAHDRAVPPGYLECFRPNVALARDRVVVYRRAQPLDDDQIRACEAKFRDRPISK
jgi:arabinofuranosyltransferase